MESATPINPIPVLLLDNPGRQRDDLVSVLKRQNIELLVCATQQEVDQVLRDRRPALAVVEYHLGQRDFTGPQPTTYLRKRLPACYIMSISEWPDTDSVDLVYQAGATDAHDRRAALEQFLVKIERVANFVGAHGQETARPGISVDMNAYELVCGNHRVALNPTEARILNALCRSDGRVISSDALMQTAGVVLERSSLLKVISTLRKKIKTIDPTLSPIVTIRNSGNRWEQR